MERSIIKAIQNDIAIYCLHTALDNAIEGVNAKICDILELNKKRILIPKPGTLKKLVTYVPQEKSDDILEKLFAAGRERSVLIGIVVLLSKGLAAIRQMKRQDLTRELLGNYIWRKRIKLALFLRRIESMVLLGLY